MRSLGLIIDLRNIGHVLPRSPLDSRRDIILGHVLRLGIDDGRAQLGITVWVRPSLLCRHRDGSCKLGKDLRHLVPPLFLRGSPILKCTSHG